MELIPLNMNPFQFNRTNSKMKHIKRIYIYIAVLLFGGFFSSCEDVIEVNVEQKQVKLVVDAFVNTMDTVQTIRLTQSIPYFATPGTESAVKDATVLIADTSNFKIFPFVHTQDGIYQWKPNKNTGDTLVVGRNYALLIIQGGDTFVSVSRLNPTVSKFDSLRTVPQEGNGPPFAGPGRYLEMFADDLPGYGNYYWIKIYRNDTFLNKTTELTISQDVGNNGGPAEGGLFIYPIRFQGVNQFTRPYRDGEIVRVEIHSITLETYFWFQLLLNESNNGGLFSTPPVNIRSNIVALNRNSKRGLAGFFCMSDVVQKSLVIRE
jgi:hypothetical protein